MRSRKHRLEILERLAAFIAGESTPREEDEVRARIAVDPEQARLLQEMRAVWDAAEPPVPDADATVHWQRLLSKLRSTARIVPLHDAPHLRGGPGSRAEPGGRFTAQTRRVERIPHSRYGSPPAARRAWRFGFPAGHGLRVAALLALLCAAIVTAARWWGLPGSDPRRGESVTEVFTTKASERALVRLNDGTEVRLNMNSRLVVPRGFSGDLREVRLEGEAYFVVAPDTLRPFVVHTGEARVEVLGTEFNMASIPQERAVEVVVAEGRVRLSHSARAVEDEAVVLRARQLGRIQEGDPRVVWRDGIDVERYLVWMSDRLVFAEAPIDEVVRLLERRYNVDIELRAPRHRIRPLDVTFERESFGDVLEVIAATLNLTYTWEEGRVTLAPAPPGTH